MSIRIGIIGAGGMTNYHVPGFVAGGTEVAAIADVNQAAAQRVAATFQHARPSGQAHADHRRPLRLGQERQARED